MSQVYLINQETFAGYEDLSINIKPQRIAVFVKKAQDLDIKLFLGHALYYDFIQYFSNSIDGALVISDSIPQSYRDLFEGSEYEDRYGHTIIYEGLIPALVYFTFARFVEADSIHYTSTGPVVKTHDAGEAVKPSDIIKLVQQHRSVANAHTNEVEKFLLDNQNNFPLWRFNEKNKSARQAGPRIRGIDKTDFNYPGTSNTGSSYLPLNEFLN